MLRLKKLYSDGMIFQQGTENDISGYADEGAQVTLSLSKDGREVFSGSAAVKDGRWSVTLPAVKGSTEPYTITVSCGSESLTVKDVYAGELFHISGQSNMELPMSRTRDPFADAAEIEEFPFIREFRVPVSCKFSKGAPAEDFAGGQWKSAVGGDIMNMSAAGYYFAADIFARLGVPVGLVNTSAGGAAVESFMPYEMIKKYGIHDEFLEEATKENYIKETSERDLKREREWYEGLGSEDFGLVPSADMKSCVVPCLSDELELPEGFSGRLFFFKEVNIPEDFPINGAELILGTITDNDVAYINGVKVGETAYMYPPRYYPIGEGILKKGKNTLAVRVDIRNGQGGFTKGRRLCIKSGRRTVNLGGEWKYAVAKTAEPLQPNVFFQGLPLALYSDMMHPAMSVKYRAFIWYQGESNCGRAPLYGQMFGDFIDFYRGKCGYEIPVIYTQLCNFGGMERVDDNDSWAELRQQQLNCLEKPLTAMAVTADIGEYNDLHPTNKREVGRRLAYCAGGLLYGDEYVFAKCTGAKAVSEGDTTYIELEFDDNVYLKYGGAGMFEAVYPDGAFPCAEAGENKDGTNRCGRKLRLSCARGGVPEKVRYAWSNSPVYLSLFDSRMAPVSPFAAEVK